MRKIAIAGSAKFWREAREWKRKLEARGYEVLAYIKLEDGSQSWRELYGYFYDGLLNADDIFVLNLDKNGTKGYIGYETFAELSNMVVRKMRGENVNVYLYQWPSEKCGCFTEISEMRKNGWVELINIK